MMSKIFGESWKTTLAGAILAGLMVLQEFLAKDEISTTKVLIAVTIAVLGRLAADEKSNG